MEYICDAPGDRTWFRLVSEGEATLESELMRHAVEKYFRRGWEKAAESFRPLTSVFIEQDIGKAAHIQREMPLFLTPEISVRVPLENTYRSAWDGLPAYWRGVLENTAAS